MSHFKASSNMAVQEPYIGRAPATGSNAVVATITINVNPERPNSAMSNANVSDTWIINIFRFEHLHQVQAEFARRRSAASKDANAQSVSANEWLNIAMPRGGFRMFYSSTRFVLISIDSVFKISEELGNVVNELKGIVESIPPSQDDLVEGGLQNQGSSIQGCSQDQGSPIQGNSQSQDDPIQSDSQNQDNFDNDPTLDFTYPKDPITAKDFSISLRFAQSKPD